MSVSFVAFDLNGAPLAGLTPTWVVYRNAVTGATPSSPTITELALGHYKFNPTAGIDSTGIIDLGSTASPRYLFFKSQRVHSFPAFDADGVPLTGLTPTWTSLRKVSGGTAYTPQPSITALAGGMYKHSHVISEHVTGVIDLGSTAFPRYYYYDNDFGGLGIYTMRAFNTNTSQYIYWQSVAVADFTGDLSGANPVDLDDIVLQSVRVSQNIT